MAKKISEDEFNEFRGFLEKVSGIQLGDTKQYLVRGRLQRVLEDGGFLSLGDLNAVLRKDHSLDLRTRVIDAMTTNETSWFRDQTPFDCLYHAILPDLHRAGVTHLRVWSAGCSSGEEPYSIALVIREFMNDHPRSFASVEIMATDVSSRMIHRASIGLFEESSLSRGLADTGRTKYFSAVDNKWAIDPEIRELVRFRQHNLLDSYLSLGVFDVVFCRNVLFYFSTARRTDIVERIVKTLRPGAFLVLGSAETIDLDALPLVRSKRSPAGMVYRLSGAREG